MSVSESEYEPSSEDSDFESVNSETPNNVTMEVVHEEAEEVDTLPATRRQRVSSFAQRQSRAERRRLNMESRMKEWHEDWHVDWDDLNDANLKRKATLCGSDQPEMLKNLRMLPFQLEGLSWLIAQEESEFNGGILADSMGMGKTVQAISLMVSRPKRTLIICPVVALMQWKSEIVKYTGELLSLHVFYGPERESNVEDLMKYDVVLSSYAVVESVFRRERSGTSRRGQKVYETSIIHQINWERIILDEAHCIKDRSCSTARAVFALKSDKKWSLSGTPLQNRVGELYSLIRFLEVKPYSSYYCEQCPCTSMTWSFSNRANCDHCGHKPMQHFCWWNRIILKPIQNFGASGEGLVAYRKLQILLDRIMLRRTKEEKADDLGLPPRMLELRKDNFNEFELDFYQALFSESRTKFAGYVRAGTVLNNYAHIFELLGKLRQAANHPYLVIYKNQSSPWSYVCGICHDVAEDPITSKCKHVFCREDIREYVQSYCQQESSVPCPVCFTKININMEQPELPCVNSDNKNTSIINRMMDQLSLDGVPWTSSTKLEALVEELDKLKRMDRTIKSIVFSQFVSFLDLIYWRLQKAGFNCVKLDGRMTAQQRSSVIESFMEIPQITVFLVSLKAGGVALNLTEASRVFIMDPWWNPATEDQAMDRIHRLGQKRPVKITRMIIENSIESRIVQLQEKKKLVFESTVGRDAAALERLTEEDLGFLFQM